MISLRTHSFLDYAIAAVLLISPWLFGFSEVVAARNLFLILGTGVVTYSLLTNYYFAVARVIPLGLHMIFDAAAGVVLLSAPLLLQYRSQITNGQQALHFGLGFGALALVAVTRPRTERAKSPGERASIAHEAPMPH